MLARSDLADFLRACARIRGSGAASKETSYYAPLEALLNAAGQGLAPRVVGVAQLAHQGAAGHADFGLFTLDQLDRGDDLRAVKTGQAPARGVVEVKSPAEPVPVTVSSAQVSKYWARYRQVLVTNLREWAFVGSVAEPEAPGGAAMPRVLDRFVLAETEDAFWALCQRPGGLAPERADEFAAFLERALRLGAPLDAPRDLAWFLASYARQARTRLEAVPPTALGDLRDGLRDALGLRFDGDKGERFFRATVVQTLFYGLFSGWVLWHRERPDRTDPFYWKDAEDYLHVPVLQHLFETLSKASTLRVLDLRDLVERAAETLGRVDRARFFGRFNVDAEAIQYFYEPFLEHYDPELRKDLGVWYTPPELVRYMVARVDEALRTELGVEAGLADDRVVVLDPCCGTGAFLVETLRHVRATLESQGMGELAAAALKRAATTRLVGFELLTAPFVVAHLQLGLALRAAGVPLHGDERAAVYLTNALTGWVATPGDAQHVLGLAPDFREEAEAARRVKRDEKILVVLGNPPYDGFAGLAVEEERDLVDAYRGAARPGLPRPQGQGLNDLYVRFFRMAERAITDDNRNGRDDDLGRAGVVCLVSNNAWLDGLSHPSMRDRMLTAFDAVWIDNLNGDKYRTGKTTPDGRPDPSAFSTAANREGIQVGTAVATLVRRRAADAPQTPGDAHRTDTVHYRDFWGTGKLAVLDALAAGGDALGSLGTPDAPAYQTVTPDARLGLPFAPRTTSDGYLDWPALPDLFPASFPGVQTKRDDLVIDTDRDRLEARMWAYFDPGVTDAEIGHQSRRAVEKTNAFDPVATRRLLQRRGYRAEHLRPHLYRPFDMRWIYWEPETNLLERKSPDLESNVFEGNVWMAAAKANRMEYDPPTVTSAMGGLHVHERTAMMVPLYLTGDVTTGGEKRPNLSTRAAAYLAGLGAGPDDLFHHALATLHAPSYRAANAGALRQDWPRVPLPATAAALRASADLGRRVAALLDVETPVPGVTSGAIDPALRPIAAPVALDGRTLGATPDDFAVAVRWGYTGHTGQVMPGPGRTAARALPAGVDPSLGGTRADGTAGAALDVFWADGAAWTGVPEAVWATTLGGYPVLKKWLSYRSRAVLGRPLRLDEVQAFASIARRLAALRLLAPALDAAHAAVVAEGGAEPPPVSPP